MGTASLGVDARSLFQRIYVLIQKMCVQVPQDCLNGQMQFYGTAKLQSFMWNCELNGQNETKSVFLIISPFVHDL